MSDWMVVFLNWLLVTVAYAVAVVVFNLCYDRKRSWRSMASDYFMLMGLWAVTMMWAFELMR